MTFVTLLGKTFCNQDCLIASSIENCLGNVKFTVGQNKIHLLNT